jgi:predicted GH43/DUF377 family glycosyl hydrolase
MRIQLPIVYISILPHDYCDEPESKVWPFCSKILCRCSWWDSKKIGAAAPPVKTKDGWVFLYHGVSDDDNVYRVGAVLLDKLNPVTILGRTDDAILEPSMPYEKEGQIPNVFFPCGNVLIGEKLFVYYGGGDSTVNVATIAIDELLRVLK